MIIANLCLPAQNIYSLLTSWQLFSWSLTNNFCFNKYLQTICTPSPSKLEKNIIRKTLSEKVNLLLPLLVCTMMFSTKNMTNTSLPQHPFSVPGDKTCSQINIHNSSNTCLFYAFCVMTGQQSKILLQRVKIRNNHPVPITFTENCNPVTVTQCCTCTVQLTKRPSSQYKYHYT